MKLPRIALLALGPLVTHAADPVPQLPPELAAGYTLSWSDEFDGPTAALDEKWSFQNKANTHILSSRWRENVITEKGILRILNKKEQRGGQEWTSGSLWTKKEFKYGYFECRYRYAAAPGVNNSFWLMTQGKTGRPGDFEIDINEGHHPNEVVMHVHDWGLKHTAKGKKYVAPGLDLSRDFHTYGLQWNEFETVWFFDGKCVHRDSNRICHRAAPVLLSAAIMEWAGKVTDAVDGTAMEVDYVRVFERPASAEHPPEKPPVGAPVKAFGLEETQPRQGLPNVLAKLKAGAEVRVAYLGGSITAADGWRVLSLKWLRDQYPTAKLSEINAAISGTPSAFGAYRLGRQVLAEKPDLLFVEFAVNDGSSNPERTRDAMEGIVRQTWQANPQTDICFVYTVQQGDIKALQSGRLQTSAAIMEGVAKHYGIPSIHLGLDVARREKEGTLIFTGPLPKTDSERAALGSKIIFTADQTHPYVETGHPLYLAAIERAWAPIEAASKERPPQMPPPMGTGAWEKAHLVPLSEVQRQGDWQPVAPNSAQMQSAGRISPPMWSAGQKGAALTFRFKGRAFGFCGLKGPDAGNFRVTVDQLPPVEDTLFDAHCVADRWKIRPWFYPTELAEGEHTVRLELLGTIPDKEKILKSKTGPLPPAQGAAANVYLSDVMVLGPIVP